MDDEAICMPNVPTMQQVIDILTKVLFQHKFELLVSNLGKINIYTPT